MTKPIAFTILALLLAPAPAAAASWAVGAPAGRMTALRAELPDATPLVPGRVLLLRGARPQVRGAAYVDDLDASRRSLAFANTEPDAPEQWYLNEDSAWSYWTIPPDLATVTVAVIDSGIDATHPEFVGRIAAGKSFVDGSSWQTDTCGHGTFVAGEIAANPYNDVGIAGIAFNAKLLVAKVVEPDCDVSTTAEIRAIIWAANHGARVINLSIGGVRDPLDPGVDTFSAPEEAAVEYAYSKGVLVVAAVGNATQSPKTPWPYADYPAALPHVLGVGAVKADGGVPDYSNRDERYVDMAAPGGPIFSTVPRNLIDASLPGCRNVPYSDCGPSDLREGIGTSFSAPQVSAAAALLIGADPSLTPQQVEWLLERSATDARATTGCPPCRAGRDSLTGWGTLDVESALARLADTATLPPVDSDEPNDDAGNAAYPFGPPKTLDATLDYWDDPVDVYSLKLRKGERLYARIGRGTVAPTSLVLWKPGTIHVTGNAKQLAPDRAARSSDLSGQARLAYRVPAAGTYYLEARIDAPSRALDAYSLSVALSRGGTN